LLWLYVCMYVNALIHFCLLKQGLNTSNYCSMILNYKDGGKKG
jgi:hypothetical protein